MVATLERICHLVIMTQVVSRKDLTATALAFKIYSEDTIHGTDAEAAFKATHVIGSTTHARKADSDLEPDVHDVITNIHLPTHPYEICPV